MGNYPSTLLHHYAAGLLHHSSATETRAAPRYGWHPDVPDRRDLYLSHYPTDSDDDSVMNTSESAVNKRADTSTDVLKVDLRRKCPAVYDDEGLGCSTVSALAALLEFHEMQTRPHTSYEPSRLFWYYLVREAKGMTRADTGASFREAWKSLNEEGVCDEVEWQFDASMYAVAPNWACYESPLQSRPVMYKRVAQTLDALKHCLTNDKPVAFGLSVYSSFESTVTRRTGQVCLPQCAADLVPGAATETEAEAHLGGQALVLVGYDDAEQMFIVRNSQGASWGANGYGFVSYAYVLNPMLARDFWVLDCDAVKAASPVDVSAADGVTEGGDETPVVAAKTDTLAKEEAPVLPPLFQELLDRVGY